MQENTSRVGVVVIGRNEGERLKRCLLSLSNAELTIVYVDSNSTDDSVAMAQSLGVEVVSLDMSIPFSAARARNEGFAKLISLLPDLDYVQFVDGDCEVCEGWIDTATKKLDESPRIAAVCGRRQERYPEASMYNAWCDLEWDTPVGTAKSTGGDFLCRTKAFSDAGGFNPSVVAGEEPELCYRIRQLGWEVQRLNHLMTLHDANMTTFNQWWRRTERCGHAYAQGAFLHGGEPERFNVKRCLSTLVWGAILPVFIVFSSLVISIFFSVLSLLYILLFFKVFRSERQRRVGYGISLIRSYSASIVVGKVPEALGGLRFFWRKLTKKEMTILEYKGASPTGS
ncbi:glycosyltransferase [Marinibactrum halimedae]|nr:glycosyltransferase [Marinibactrum halimedae]MCD9459763.1 glycosyltransferase [Marinibactrum halimedae]